MGRHLSPWLPLQLAGDVFFEKEESLAAATQLDHSLYQEDVWKSSRERNTARSNLAHPFFLRSVHRRRCRSFVGFAALPLLASVCVLCVRRIIYDTVSIERRNCL